MFKRILTTLLALTSYSLVSASQFDFLQPPGCSFSGTFSQSKSLRGLATPLLSSGYFFYHCELGVIWKTHSPIKETLVLRKAASTQTPSYRIDDGLATPLKSRQAQVLGELINGFIAADKPYINKQFLVTSTIEGGLVLQPKKRRIKRAIKRIELRSVDRPSATKDQTIKISILDRNQQWTHIVSHHLASYSAQTKATEQCLEAASFSKYECAVLNTIAAQ